MISCGSYLDLHGAGGECCDLLLHPVTDTWVHGGATGQHVIGVQVLTDVDVALHDAIVGGFMDACRLHAYRGQRRDGVIMCVGGTYSTKPSLNRRINTLSLSLCFINWCHTTNKLLHTAFMFTKHCLYSIKATAEVWSVN